MNIIKFEDAKLPAYLTSGVSLDINKEVVRGSAFPTMSIKGMKFTINRDGVKTIITKPDDPDEVAQNLQVVFVRANLHAKTFYMKRYSEGESDNTRPDCYSFDGVAPSPNAVNPQAKKCALCPNNQWGSRSGDDGESKGKACQDNARIAVSAPDKVDPILLRVPPKSLKPLRETLKLIAARKLPYNSAVIRIGFDREAPSPVLTFKPVGLLDERGYNAVHEAYESELVRAIVGLDDEGYGAVEVAKPTSTIDTSEIDAAITARDATKKAASRVSADDLDDMAELADLAPKPAPKPAPAKPVKHVTEDDLDGFDEPPKAAKPAKAKPAEKKPSSGSDLLSGLEDLLGSTDD